MLNICLDKDKLEAGIDEAKAFMVELYCICLFTYDDFTIR